jgi:hypothetical protein
VDDDVAVRRASGERRGLADVADERLDAGRPLVGVLVRVP